MRIQGMGGALGRGAVSYQPRPARGDASLAAPSTTQQSVYELGSLYRRLARLREQLKTTEQTLKASFRTTAPSVRSAPPLPSAPLNLSAASTPARLESTAEINNIGTSFAPVEPQFAGASTASPSIAGVYTGSVDETHTFRVDRGGTVGRDNLRIGIYDQTNRQIDTVRIIRNDPAGTGYSLNSGLVLSLSDGELTRNDEFQVAVSASVGATVRPDKPFDGIGVESPNFEPGVSVASGSFQLNGETILVAAGDSINSVAAKITASDAGVSAAFDAGRERLVLTSKTSGANGQITLGADSSGFVEAVKLAGAVVAPGTDPDLLRPIEQVSQLSSVTSGGIEVDQTPIDLDISIDSLQRVLNSIEAVPHVHGRYEGGAVRISRDFGKLHLADGTSNFFTALGIATGDHDFGAARSAAPRRLQPSRRADIAATLERLAGALNSVLGDASRRDPEAVAAAGRLGQELLDAAAAAGAESRDGGQHLAGIQLQASGGFAARLNQGELLSALRQDPQQVRSALLAEPSSAQPHGGLLTQLDDLIRDHQHSLLDKIAARGGQLVDLLA